MKITALLITAAMLEANTALGEAGITEGQEVYVVTSEDYAENEAAIKDMADKLQALNSEAEANTEKLTTIQNHNNELQGNLNAAKAEIERLQAGSAQVTKTAAASIPIGEMPEQKPGFVLAFRPKGNGKPGNDFKHFSKTTWDLMGPKKGGWAIVPVNPAELNNN